MDAALTTSYSRKKLKFKGQRVRFGTPEAINRDFTCSHCKNFVSANSLVSGVKNRNHCPYCLHSRHMDLHKAGDRLAACKSVMEPVGLALKSSRKKYGQESRGELMLVHLCVDCGKVSINRIASDDDLDLILAILDKSSGLDRSMKERLEREGIRTLNKGEKDFVRRNIFGMSWVKQGNPHPLHLKGF